jgi:hypothetical protein
MAACDDNSACRSVDYLVIQAQRAPVRRATHWMQPADSGEQTLIAEVSRKASWVSRAFWAKEVRWSS